MLKLPLLKSGNPPVEQAGFPNLLSKCTHVGVSDIGSTKAHTPEFTALLYNLTLCVLLNVWPTSKAVPA